MAVFAGFSSFRPVISVGVIGLIVFGLLGFDIRQTLRSYVARPVFYINVVFFLVILLSYFNSDNKSLWLTFIQIKLPFLLLPLAFCSFTFFDRAFLNKLLLLFSFIMVISAIGVMVHYWLHYDELTVHIRSGGVIPTPFSHIRFTLLLVFAFFCLIWLWEERIVEYRSLLLIPTAFIFIVIHILSSRSGWLALYIALLFYVVSYIWRYRHYLTGAMMFASIVILPVVFYFFIPSFQNKVDYMTWSMGEYKTGHIDNMSDAMRIASWQSGLAIIRQHPLTGVGVGDLLAESKRASHELFPDMQNESDRKMPHNEFIWIWAATGVFGFLAYFFAFVYPFVASIAQRNWLFAVLFIIFLSAFMTEVPMEEQIGSTFYLMFLLIFLTHFTYRSAAHD